MGKITQKIDINRTALNLIMLSNCFLWFFEDLLQMHILVVLIYAAALGFLLLKRKITFQKCAAVMILYVLGIFLSFAVNGATFRTVYRASLILMMVAFANIADFDEDTMLATARNFAVIGMVMAGTVMLHFILKGTFADWFYGLFDEKTREEALFYYDRGYYAGMSIKPHETAGMIAMAVGALLISRRNGNNRIFLLVPLAMFVPLLLTGKRAVTALTVVAALALYILPQIVNRRWKKVLKIIAAALAGGLAVVLFIKFNPDFPLFGRFAAQLNDASESFVDGTRLALWDHAWQLWTENKLFGVGWWRYNDLSVTRFHHLRSHSVNLDYLQWLCETGIVGFVLMMTPIVCELTRAVKLGIYASKAELPARTRDLIWFAVYIQIFILLYAFVEVPFYNNLFFAYYVFSCIIIHAYYPGYCGKGEKKEKRRPVPAESC